MQTHEPRTLSVARIDANRENAKKSTGPRTPEGKAASSRNRLVHGLRANKHILIGDDDPADFLLLLQSLDQTFRPVGEAEEMLVTQIAHDQWRLDRALPLEAGIFRQCLESVDSADYRRRQAVITGRKNHERDPRMYSPAPDPPAEGDRLARAFVNDCSKPNSLAVLTRYKAAIQLSIDRSLRQLKMYQTARLANAPDPGPQPSPTSGEVEQPIEREPAATPPSSTDYHSNPTNADGALLAHPTPQSCPQPEPGSAIWTAGTRADHRFMWSAFL